MTIPGDAICEFQTDSPETKTNEVVSTKGIQNQEQSLIKEVSVLIILTFFDWWNSFLTALIGGI